MNNSKNVRSMSIRSIVSYYATKDHSNKAIYTNPALISVGNALISLGLGDTEITIECQSGVTPNRGSFAEIATRMLVSAILEDNNENALENTTLKAQRGKADIDLSGVNADERKALGLDFKGGLIEVKYANSNTKASEIENPKTTKVLLLTQNGYSLVKREKLIIDPKTRKIFAKSEKNGRVCHLLNEYAGF